MIYLTSDTYMKFQYIKDKGKAGTTGSCNVDTSQPDWFIRQTFGVEINGKPVQNSTALSK